MAEQAIEAQPLVSVWFRSPVVGPGLVGDAVTSVRHVVAAACALQTGSDTAFIDQLGDVVARWPTSLIARVDWAAQLTLPEPSAPPSLASVAPVGSREWLAEVRRQYPRAYERWTAEEEQLLVGGYRDGRTFDELAVILGRRPGGAGARLVLLGLVEEGLLSPTPMHDVPPAILCDGCGIGVSDAQVLPFERDPSGASNDRLELCADCYSAALEWRKSPLGEQPDDGVNC